MTIHNDEKFELEFLVDTDYLIINDWKLPKCIKIETHFPGSYSRTKFYISCISPDGLKVDFEFEDKESTHEKDVLCYFFSKLWFTMCNTAEELDCYIFKDFRCYTNNYEKVLTQMVRSVAMLDKMIASRKIVDKNKIDFKWALQKEYEYSLRNLFEVVKN